MENKKKEFKPVPEGTYLMRMTEYVEAPTQNGKGIMAKARFKIASGDQKDQMIFKNFLVKHESEKAQEIGLKTLDNYLKAVNNGEGLNELGYDRSNIAEELTGIPFNGVVVIEPEREYEDKISGETKVAKARNDIKYFNCR